MFELMKGDCLDLMKQIPDNSIDMILCDLPYGTTACKWDSVIPFAGLWSEYRRIISFNGAIVLTASQPFTSALVMSNIKDFKYQWVWHKSRFANQMLAKKQPLKIHEDVVVFCTGKTPYIAQGLTEINRTTKQGSRVSDNNGGGVRDTSYVQTHTNYPRSILQFASEGKPVHSTQKPVALMEYLLRTYTHEGMTVLDNCMGSGTTGVACANTGRKFIGIEMDEKYFEIAKNRVESAYSKNELEELK